MTIRLRDRPAPAVVVYRAADTLFDDVVVHTADGMGWIVQRSENFTLRVNEAQQQGRVSYHLREGKHDLNLRGWTRYMDFFDQWRSWGL